MERASWRPNCCRSAPVAPLGLRATAARGAREASDAPRGVVLSPGVRRQSQPSRRSAARAPLVRNMRGFWRSLGASKPITFRVPLTTHPVLQNKRAPGFIYCLPFAIITELSPAIHPKTINMDNGHVDSGQFCHLKKFCQAKDNINELFLKLDSCLSRASQFYSQPGLDPELNDKSANNHLEILKLKERVEDIRCILARNQMKVAFFGRTSNGKSTVINAILHDRVLPSGYGHTTGCFLQIQGNPADEAYIEVMRNGQTIEKKPLHTIEHDVNALNSDALEHSSLVKIHWPISKCPLLKYDVVLVDSPGVDVEDNLDEWIDKHCKDADVFVLVSNAESTLNNAEKKFFHRVSEKLSNPIIFILNNRWDSIADDPRSMDRVRVQHVKRAVEFLSNELKINNKQDAEDRIFFVSARETLDMRSPVSSDHSRRSQHFKTEGYETREQEFINFERRFEESLSKSAVKTKFKNHTDRGEMTINELNSLLDNTRAIINNLLLHKGRELPDTEAHYAEINQKFYNRIGDIEQTFREMKHQILIMTDDEFDYEISRLSRIVEDFDMKFSPNPRNLVYYKQQLYQHIEDNLSENLQNRINSVITKGINPIKKLLCDISQLLSEDRQKIVKEIIGSELMAQEELFDLAIYRQFYTEFQEDLEFRFSLGLFRIIRKLQNMTRSSHSAHDHKHPPQQHPQKDVSKDSSLDRSQILQTDTDFVSIMERFLLTSPQSPTTIGSLAFGGILVRTVGWRVIIFTSLVYGALYAYEYLTWTNSAKERTFKTQYTRYAKKGLRSVSESITKHIANSVEQRMNNVFVKFKNEIDAEDQQVVGKLSFLRDSMKKLETCESFLQELCGQNNLLKTELLNFASIFLN